MEGETIHQSHWFRRLLADFRASALQAATEGLFVCVPQTCSLQSLRITKYDIGEWSIRWVIGMRMKCVINAAQ